VKIWWILLSIVSALNIGAWLYSVRLFFGRKPIIHPNIYRWRRLMLWLSGVYVIGCAFRSLLPRIDLERICLVDSWLSSMIVGRTVAAIAEICFITQCAVLLREAGIGVNNRLAIIVSLSLLPIIVIAEGFSWYAVISTHYFGSVVEESLWTVSGVLLVTSFFALWPYANENQRPFLMAMIVFGVGFILFMVTVDVPMYWSRWQEDTTVGLEYLPFKHGILDASKPCIVNFDWQVWREEIPWMTLYFTAAVWVSIYLTHAPSFKIAWNNNNK
jgi:hypothetical protein